MSDVINRIFARLVLDRILIDEICKIFQVTMYRQLYIPIFICPFLFIPTILHFDSSHGQLCSHYFYKIFREGRTCTESG
jgi:hypothetical protein